jgi:tripartite-type tricarboxylate transporter receptor subunit TctC
MTTRRTAARAAALAAGRRALLAGLAALAVPRPLRAAEAWPTRPIRLIVPFPPGGPSDSVGRIIGEALARLLGQAVVVENRPGAGSVIGTAAAAQSTDGHTLLLTSNSFTVNPSLVARLPYDSERDFEPVGLISNTPLVLAVPAASALRDVAGLVAEAKARPGALTYGSAGNGTVNHLASELFKLRTGTDVLNVTYRGDGPLLTDLVAGRLSLAFLNLPSALPLARDGRVRVLATLADAPLAALPGIPTLDELGIPDLKVAGMQALLAARGVPEDGLQRLDTALAAVLAEPGLRDRLAALGALPSQGGREALRVILREQTARWAEVIRVSGIRAE